MTDKTIDPDLLDALEPGDACPVEGCPGHMDSGTPENCSCHLAAPCSSCENAGLECDDCGLDTAEDWKERRHMEAEDNAQEDAFYAELEAKARAKRRGARRHETTTTHTANAFNSTPFTRCCGIAALNTDRCPNCEALITFHDDGLSARRREVGPGNCLMCGKKRGNPAIAGNCHC